MSHLTLILQIILRSEEPLTAEQVAEQTGFSNRKCSTYLYRLAVSNRIKRDGIEDRGKIGRPQIRYHSLKISSTKY